MTRQPARSGRHRPAPGSPPRPRSEMASTAVGDHGHGHVDGQQGGVVERRHERLDGGRQGGGVAHQEERHAQGQEGQRADGVAVLEQEVAAQDAHGEGDGELVHVAPRPAADDDGPRRETARQEQEARPGEAVADGRQRPGARHVPGAYGTAGRRDRGGGHEASHCRLRGQRLSCRGQERREGHGSHEGEEQQQRAAHEEILRELGHAGLRGTRARRRRRRRPADRLPGPPRGSSSRPRG